MNEPTLEEFVKQLEKGERLYFSPELRALARRAIIRSRDPVDLAALVDKLATQAASMTD